MTYLAKTWFKIAKQLTDKNSSTPQIPILIENGTEATSDIEKTEMLNTYFCKQSSIDDSNHVLPPLILPQHNISSIHISPTDICDAISSIDPSKACGPEPISPRLLREGINELSSPLSIIFNILMNSSHFPSSWKLANVIPILKKNDRSNPQNYRPISLLSCIAKLMERCIHKYLYNI